MRTLKQHSAILLSVTALALPMQNAWAATDALPTVTAPAGFEEGTESQLSADQMSEILPWAENSETTLKDLLETTRSFGYVEARDTLVRGIEDLVLASAPKRTELLMRYVLNRALKVHRQIEAQVDVSQPGVIDLQVRMLRASVRLAFKYYQSDLAYMNGRFVEKKTDLAGLPYASFGLEYAHFLMTLDQSLFDASAQYEIATLTLGLLEWDLYRDKDKLLYAPVIAKIDRFLKLAPKAAPAQDGDSVKWLRRVKKVYQDALSQTIELMKKTGKALPPVIAPEAPLTPQPVTAPAAPPTTQPVPAGTVRIELTPGTRVFPDAYSQGYATVIGVHPSTGVVTVEGNISKNYNRYSADTIAFANGCFKGICVGERWLPQSYSQGYATVIAINPQKGTLTVLGDQSDDYHRFTPGQLDSLKGCYSGFCVGERVLPDTYESGYATVVAVSPGRGVITVLGNQSTSYHRFTPGQLMKMK